MTEELERKVTVNGAPPCPHFDASLGRVNVVLGTNGTGKTSLLKALKGPLQQFVADMGITNVSIIHGERILHPSGKSNRQRQELRKGERLLRNMWETIQLNTSHLERDADYLLESMCRDHLTSAREHSEACSAWEKGGRATPFPGRRTSSLERVQRLFTSVFPEIELRVDVDDVSLRCVRNSVEYEPQSLSTGEKQVLLFLQRLAQSSEPECFLIDEPDRNLNAALAERLWDIVETELHEKSMFVYTTHLPSFAMRANVEHVFVLDGKRAREIEKTRGFLDIPRHERVEFLGAIPSIVVRQRVLVVEGQQGGIDESVYRTLLDSDDVEVVPIESCSRVRSAVAGVDPWNTVTEGVRIAGVMERDFRPDSEIAAGGTDCLFWFPFHEIESVFCHPGLLRALLDAMYPAGTGPRHEELAESILESARASIVEVACRRTTARLGQRQQLVMASELDAVDGADCVRALLADKHREFLTRVSQVSPTDAFDEEIAQLTDTVDQKDWGRLLQVFEGKRLVKPVLGRLRIGTTMDLLGMVRHHVGDFACIPELCELRDQIAAALNSSTDVAGLE